jgi:hypothetical protein
VPKREKRAQAGFKVLQWVVPLALAVLLAVLGYQLSLSLASVVEQSISNSRITNAVSSNPSQPSNTASKQSASSDTNPSASPLQGDKQTASAKRRPGGELVAPLGEPPPSYHPGQGAWPARWMLSAPFYLVGIFLLLVANIVLTTRPGVVTEDSQTFTDALEQVWYKLVLAKQSTPRAAKRFVNRVRYLAMRQRAYSEQGSLWERVLFPQRLREPSSAEKLQTIPEPLLVAMAAIEQLEPVWIYDRDAFMWLAKSDSTLVGYPGTNAMSDALIEEARADHIKTFNDKFGWEALSAHRNRFVAIWPRTDPTEPA